MILLAGSLVYDLVAILTALVVVLVTYYKWSFGYWKRRGVESLDPSIPFGDTTKLFTVKFSFGEQFADFYKQFKARGLKHGGVFMFARPFYIPVDPDIIKPILLNDFSHFVNRGFYINETADPLSGHLFNLEDAKWKSLRAKLTATFTSGKMKMMFDTIADCTKGLDSLIGDSIDNHQPLNIKDILERFTIQVISSCAFGVESNTLKNPNNDFQIYGKRIVEHTIWENIQQLLQFAVPTSILQLVNFKVSKPDVEEFIMKLVKSTVEYREKNNIARKDFLHLLIQLKNRGMVSDDDKIMDNGKPKEAGLSLYELAAQVFVFFAGGFETSATTMSWALYELSKHQDIQDKLREEIRTVLEKYDNKITYDALMEMSYLDKVIWETLRKYPPLPFLNRQCTVPYTVPGTDVQLEKGTMVVIPIQALQNDPEFFPNPKEFQPERFNEENKRTRPAITWMPFGEGPRNCIGSRFGMLQSKIGVTAILRNYRLTLSGKPVEPVLRKTTIVMVPMEPILLNASKV